MTRKEIEQLNEVEPYRLVTEREEQLYRVRLQEGFSIADDNPKSPWISVDDEMPYDYTELLINQDTTVPILTKTERWGYFVQYMYYSPTQGWRFTEGGGVEYWMPIPKLPKK